MLVDNGSHLPELSGWEKVVLPLLQILQLHIKAWADDTTLQKR